MKKLSVLCLALFLSFVLPQPAHATDVFVGSNKLVMDQEPIIENGRTLVPVRAIFEALGSEVVYNQDTQTIVSLNDKRDRIIILQINQPMLASAPYHASVERVKQGEITFKELGSEMALTARIIDVAPKIVNNRTLVPVRVISESLGANVTWDEASHNIYIL